MSAPILLLEDELSHARRLIPEIEKKFPVHLVLNAEDALVALQEMPELTAMVVDVMMPPPLAVPDADTSGGLDTGIWVLEQAAGYLISTKLPIFVYTNRLPDHVDAKIRELGFPYGQIEWGSKQRVLQADVPYILDRMVTARSSLPAFRSLEHLDGFDVLTKNSLTKLNIQLCEHLHRRTRDRKGCEELAKDTGLPIPSIELLAAVCDLIRVREIGGNYASLLFKAGIKSVVELSQADGTALAGRLRELNDQARIFYSSPTEAQVRRWLASAKILVTTAEESSSQPTKTDPDLGK